MLETIREFGLECLAQSGQEHAIRQCQAHFFLDMAEARVGWERMEEDHDNLRAALTWSLDVDPELALNLANAMIWFWIHRGYWSEGDEWLEKSLARTADCGRTATRGIALHGRGVLAHWRGADQLGRAPLEESLAIGRDLGDWKMVAHCLGALGNIEIAAGTGNLAAAMARYDELLA